MRKCTPFAVQKSELEQRGAGQHIALGQHLQLAHVKAGTPLLKVDLDAIRAAGHPTATAIIVTNGDDMGELKMLAEGDVLAGTPLFKF